MKIFVFFGSLLFAVLVYSQPPSASIRGDVRDVASKKPLSGVNVFIEFAKIGQVTDGEGAFHISSVPAGVWFVTARVLGYDPATQKVVVKEGQEVRLNFLVHENFFQMGQMVVTATRSEKLMQDVPVVTEVVSASDIQDRGAENLAQALEDRPGIVVEPNSSGGKVLRMNGLDGKHVLILKDGVPVAGKLNSRVEMNLFDVDNVDRIEIVKGPGSALYGSEAMGGVINIISKGFTETLRANAKLRGGSFDLYSGDAGLSGTLAGVGFIAGIDHQQGGIDKNEVNINISEQKNSGGFGKFKWENRILGGLGAGVEYKQDLQKSDDKNRLNQAVDHDTRVKRTGWNLNWDKTLTKRVAFKATGYISDYFRTYSNTTRVAGAKTSTDTSKEKLTGFRSDFFHQWGKNVLMDFGYDYSQDYYFSVRVKNREITRNQNGFFGQAEIKPLPPLTLVVGGRYDKITNLAGHFSPRLSAMWSVTPDWKFRAAWGEGFRAPNFIDMYTDYRNPYVIVLGNPDLKPERSQGLNMGVEYLWNYRILVNATVSQNRFKNMIVDYTMIPGTQTTPSTLSYINIANSTFTGFELQSRFYLTGRLTTTLNYNYTQLDAHGQSNALNTIYPHTASIRLMYTGLKNKLKISLRDQFYSARDIKPFDNITTQNYQVVHLSAIDLMDVTVNYHLFSCLDLRAGVTNLRDYINKQYGPWIGRRYFAGLEMSY